MAAAVVLPSCSRPASDEAELVKAALLAQASGPGGCRDLGQVITTTSAFFPGVRFFEAPCVREHGDTVVVNAAIDGEGTPFLLNSRSEFRFLLSQHRPVGIDSSNVVDYGLMTLFLTGEITGWAELVRDADSVPEAQLATAGFKRGELTGSGVQDFPHGVRIVWVTVSSGGDFLTYGMTLDTASGEMVIVQRPGDR